MPLGCKSFAARQWLSEQPGALSVLVGAPAVDTRSSGAGRGIGLFASRSIPRYSEISRDPVACLMKPTDDLPQLYERFLELSEERQAQYLALSYRDDPEKDAVLTQKLLHRGYSADEIPKRVKVGHIMQNNAFTVDTGGPHGTGHRALFLNIARINHSCAPNAHVSFYPPSSKSDPEGGSMVVHTLRDIRADEEILISYFSILMPRPERQAKSLKWGFECDCPACDQSQPYHKQTERRRKAFAELKAEQAAIMKNPNASLKALRTLLDKASSLIKLPHEDESLRPTLPDLYDDLAMLEAKLLLITKREKQREAVVSWLEKSLVWEARITGVESSATRKRLEKLGQFAGRRGDEGRPRIGEKFKDEEDVMWGSG